MKKLLLMLFVLASGGARAGLWTDDFDAALAQAKAENRMLILNFTGSDWCGWCKRLDAEVFSKPAFKDYAKENLVCVTLDFPQGYKVKKKTKEQNEKLAKEFGIKGYPSILLLDPEGKKIAKTGYKDGGAESYVAHLEGLLKDARGKFGKTRAAAAPGLAPAAPGAAPAAAAFRTWTSASGSTLEAKVEQRAGNKVYLRTRDNRQITIETSSLSEADQAFLRGAP